LLQCLCAAGLAKTVNFVCQLLVDQRTVRLLDVCWNEEDRLMGRIYLDMTVVTLPMEALVLERPFLG